MQAEHDGSQEGTLDETQALALEVLDVARSKLLMDFRFLDRALWKMPAVSDATIGGIGTDGVCVRYAPPRLLKRYCGSADEVVRDYLHMILHCVFYHPFVAADVETGVWNLACDIVTESCCMELALARYESQRDIPRRRVVQELTVELGTLSAEKLYRHFMQHGFGAHTFEELSSLFTRDDHAPWFAGKPTSERSDADEGDSAAYDSDEAYADEGRGGGEGQDDDAESDEDGMCDADAPQDEDAGAASREDAADDAHVASDEAGAAEPDETQRDECADMQAGAEPGEESDDAGESAGAGDDEGQDEERQLERAGQDGDAKEQWQEVSKQLKVDLETRSREYGTRAGTFTQQLGHVNRRRHDYREFLRSFCEIAEEMSISDTDFDPVFYTYGLNLYGNMPLVEPLEYRESHKIRDFVIAIDTSSSVQGALVRRFVEETFDILSDSSNFFSHVNVHVMQCDARIQNEVTLTCREDFERYMGDFEIQGLGGTDFRPVFRRVDELVEQGEFTNLKGLIYFTDGCGVYPDSPPDYDVAFVFVEETDLLPLVPSWAFRLVFEPEDLEAQLNVGVQDTLSGDFAKMLR